MVFYVFCESRYVCRKDELLSIEHTTLIRLVRSWLGTAKWAPILTTRTCYECSSCICLLHNCIPNYYDGHVLVRIVYTLFIASLTAPTFTKFCRTRSCGNQQINRRSSSTREFCWTPQNNLLFKLCILFKLFFHKKIKTEWDHSFWTLLFCTIW